MLERRSIKIVYTEGQDRLADAGIHDAAFDARELLSFVMGIPFKALPLHYGDEVTGDQLARYEELIERRIHGEPLQYITGEQEFMGLTFHVDPRVLIPRLDTEILAEEALKHIDRRSADQSATEPASADQNPAPLRVLDLCCGSGAIGLSIAKLAYENGGSQLSDKADIAVVLADISNDALDVAKQNAEALGVLDRVDFVQGDLFGGFGSVGEAGSKASVVTGNEGFDLIVSNPPYVRSDVIPTLDAEVKDHEPMLALDGGTDGLDIYRRIANDAPDHLKHGGCLMMEIGCDQAEDVKKLLEASFDDVSVKKDLAGLDRVVIALLQ